MRKERRGINGKTEKRAEFALRILLDILIVALLLVIGRVAYTGAYSVFRNRSMEDPPGREVSVPDHGGIRQLAESLFGGASGGRGGAPDDR